MRSPAHQCSPVAGVQLRIVCITHPAKHTVVAFRDALGSHLFMGASQEEKEAPALSPWPETAEASWRLSATV